MQLNVEETNILKQYVHSDLPLGPIDSSRINHNVANIILFEKQNKIYEKLTKHPSIIVGRKGAGKTAFLKNITQSKKFSVYVELKTEKAFSGIVRSINRSIEKTGFMFPDEVSDLWDFLFWTALSAAVREKFPTEARATSLISRIAKFFDLKKGMSPETIFNTVLKVISKKLDDDELGIAAEVVIQLIGNDGDKIETLKEEVCNILRNHKTNAVILIDSLDNYRIDMEVMPLALQGLLMNIGQFNVIRKRPEIRFCMPAELYTEFLSISSNRLKDFNQRLILHWLSGELLSMAAHRYRVYLNLYQDGDANRTTELNSLDVHNREGAIQFFSTIFPPTIRNRLGINEDPVAYLLRHTQLLPRQILKILTEIIRKNRSNGSDPTRISENAIIEGVKDVEADLWGEVCIGYKHLYPYAKRICDAMVPELSLAFSDGDLHSIFVQHGKKIADEHSLAYQDVKRMLIEIGCIGAVIERTDTYIEGMFEYTMPDSLVVGASSELCLHPIFCGGAKTETMVSEGITRVVYPYGTDPDAEDHRDFDEN